MNSKILVLTPTLGNRSSLANTINSVEKIGGDLVKHIIICPENEVENIKRKYPKTEIIAEPKGNKGIYGALNYGFEKLAKNYEYMTFLNDDDFWLEDYKKLIDFILNNKSVDLVYGRVLFYKDKRIFEQACSNQFNDFLSLYQNKVVLLTQQATLFKSKLFYELNGFSPEYILISDTKFFIDLSLKKIKYKFLNVCCAGYTLQDDQLSSNKELQNSEYLRLMNNYHKIFWLKIKFDIILFRLLNLNIYLKRWFF